MEFNGEGKANSQIPAVPAGGMGGMWVNEVTRENIADEGPA